MEAPLIKPKLALKLVPISGLLFDLHTAHYAHFGVAKLHTLNNTNQSGGEKNTEPVSFSEARFQLKKRFVFAPWKTPCHGSTAHGVFRSHSSTAPRAISPLHCALHLQGGSGSHECHKYVAFSISAHCTGRLKSELNIFKCHIYIVFCIRGLAPCTVLDVSLLTKTSHECRSYIVFCIPGLAKRATLL